MDLMFIDVPNRISSLGVLVICNHRVVLFTDVLNKNSPCD